MRNVNQHTIVVSVASDTDVESLVGMPALLKGGFTATRGAAFRCPTVVLRGVDKRVPADQLPGAIWCRNKDLLAGHVANEEQARRHIRALHRLGNEAGPVVAWVLLVTPEVRQCLVNAGQVFVGLRFCKVSDRVATSQCSKCWGFGHSAKVCTAQTACRHCGRRGHIHAQCPYKSQEPRCPNCLAAGRVDRRHRPDDQSRCVAWELAKLRLAASTNYAVPGGSLNIQRSPKPKDGKPSEGDGPGGKGPGDDDPTGESGLEPTGTDEPAPSTSKGDGGEEAKDGNSRKEDPSNKSITTDEPKSKEGVDPVTGTSRVDGPPVDEGITGGGPAT